MRVKKIDDEFVQKNPVHPAYQIIFISISALCISTILYFTLHKVSILDEQPAIERISPQKYKDLGGFPSEITTGIHINKFETFDVVKNQFLIDCVVWFKYISGSISLQTLELFSFNRGEIVKKSAPEVSIDNEYMIARYTIKVKFSSNLNYKKFPVDSHRIYLALTNDFLDPREVLFKASEEFFIIDRTALEAGWEIIDKHVNTGYDRADFGENNNSTTQQGKLFPITIFSFDIKRYGSRHLITIFLPLLLIFYISFCGLSVKSGSLRLGIMAVSAIIGYRFVIENMSPNTSYFMVSDHIFFLFLFANLSVFSLIIIKLYTDDVKTWQLKLAIACIHMIVIGLSSYILLNT